MNCGKCLNVFMALEMMEGVIRRLKKQDRAFINLVYPILFSLSAQSQLFYGEELMESLYIPAQSLCAWLPIF